MHHSLKCDSEYFEAVAGGSKTFEVRKNDRQFKVGHYLVLRELDSSGNVTGSTCVKQITYILTDAFPGLVEGYVCMALKSGTAPDAEIAAGSAEAGRSTPSGGDKL